MWEAMLAGSIPIVLRIPGLYKNCENPSHHLLSALDRRAVVHVNTWDQLPLLLEIAVTNTTRLRLMQWSMSVWLKGYSVSALAGLLDASRRMAASARLDRVSVRQSTSPQYLGLPTTHAGATMHPWRRRTSCRAVIRSPASLFGTMRYLSRIWRREQGFVDSPDEPSWIGRPLSTRRWYGTKTYGKGIFTVHGGYCADYRVGETFSEGCAEAVCSVPLINDFVCEPVAPAGDRSLSRISMRAKR